MFRRRYPKVFCKINVLKKSVNFTRKHLNNLTTFKNYFKLLLNLLASNP